MKIDLAMAKELVRLEREYLEKSLEVAIKLARLGTFCDICGETHPEGGFYPLGIHGPNSISGFQCTPCREAMDESS